MGILDDAIREHLELKRQRGADPGEIDRLEREALGPVRRGPQDSADLSGHHEGTAPGNYSMEEEVAGWVDAGEGPVPFDEESEPYSEPSGSERWPEPAARDEFQEPAATGYAVDPGVE